MRVTIAIFLVCGYDWGQKRSLIVPVMQRSLKQPGSVMMTQRSNNALNVAHESTYIAPIFAKNDEYFAYPDSSWGKARGIGTVVNVSIVGVRLDDLEHLRGDAN
jgi:hypothetical protein